MAEEQCSVCSVSGSEDKPLVRCYNPRCRRPVCAGHALTFELHEETDTLVAPFCSRACYAEMQRRSLPAARELMIVLIVLAAVIPIYLTVVSYFTRAP